MEYIQNVLEEVPIENKSVLDIATGTGVLIPFLQERGAKRIVGVDISDEMLSFAREKYPEIEFIQTDLLEYSKPEQYDLLVCYNAYPHFLDPEAFLQKCQTLLAPEGEILIFHDKSPEQINELHEKAHMLENRVARKLEPVEIERETFEKFFELLPSREDIFVLRGGHFF